MEKYNQNGDRKPSALLTADLTPYRKDDGEIKAKCCGQILLSAVVRGFGLQGRVVRLWDWVGEDGAV